MTLLFVVVVPRSAVSLLAAALLAVAGLRLDKTRTLETSGAEPVGEGEAPKRSAPEPARIHSSEKR